jgi:Holliday junction resolvase
MTSIKKSKNSKYIAGRDFEYQLISLFEKQGFYCVRSAGSKGLYDIVVLKNKDRFFCVQCKVSKTLSNQLLENSISFKELLALLEKDKISFKENFIKNNFFDFSDKFFEILAVKNNRKLHFFCNFE